MNREALEARLALIAKAIDESIANLNILIGRKSELEYLLTELAREGASAPPAAEIGGPLDDYIL